MLSENELVAMRRQVDLHEIRLDALEALLKAQTEALNQLIKNQEKIHQRLTIIGTVLVTVIGLSSENVGALLRAMLRW